MSEQDWVARIPSHGSWSQLNTWQDCQVAYVLQKAFAPPEAPAWWFIGGTAFHEATEQWDKDPWHGGAEELFLWFEQRFDAGIVEAEETEPDRTKWRAADKGKQREKFYRENASAWCELYVAESQYWLVHTLPNDELAIEAEFDIRLGGIQVKGYIDRLRVSGEGLLGVEDLKTGKKNGSDQQLGLYATATELQHNERPTWGRFWNPRLGGGSVPISLDPYSKDFYDDSFGRFEAGRRSGNPVPSTGRHCDWCSVRDFCSFQNGRKAIDLT